MWSVLVTQYSFFSLPPQSPQGQLSRGGVPSVGVRGVSHSFSSSSSQLQSAVAAAALVSRPGKHAHVRPAAQGSKGSSSGNSSRGSAQATAWRKQNNINTGRLIPSRTPTYHHTSLTYTHTPPNLYLYTLNFCPVQKISRSPFYSSPPPWCLQVSMNKYKYLSNMAGAPLRPSEG